MRRGPGGTLIGRGYLKEYDRMGGKETPCLIFLLILFLLFYISFLFVCLD